MSEAKQFGLGEDWHSVEEVLKEIIPVYDKTNRYISLGSDLKIRKTGLALLKQSLRNPSESLILDLGCGTGRMTKLLGVPSVMLDALRPMMRIAKERNLDAEGVLAIFENLPLKKGIFQGAMAGFAIRDARRLRDALSEISEILRVGGFFLVVDLSKPDSILRKRVIALYWRVLAPLIAFFAAGRLGLRFAALSTTYQRLPTNSEFLNLAEEAGFDLVASKYFMLGGASSLLFRKHA